jgi:sugar lactone lactonase YvrE
MRRRAAALIAVLAVLTLGSPVASAAPSRHPDPIPLPDGFRPEGIATGPAGVAYVGSLADGDILRVDLATGRHRVLSQGPGTPSVGLKTDGRTLFVAGGPAGEARVVDTRTGAVTRRYQLVTGTTFVNDVVLTRGTAWFTDSRNPVLYGVPRSGRGEVVRLPLGGDYRHVPDVNNANGIERTPDGRALLVVQSSTGTLFRVDPATGVARTVDLGGYVLTNGDGLLLVGRTLYVVQNRLNTVAVLALDRNGTRGRLVDKITDPRFDVPTTVARSGHRLYLPNARFTTPPTPDTTYTVVAVRR